MNTLVGNNIDLFHKNPSHQRGLLERLQSTHRATIHVGGRAFDLVVSPLRSGGRRIGLAVEWADAEARLRNLDYEAQIAAIGRNQPVVEFSLDGVIRNANEQYLKLTGYSLAEIRLKRHAMLVDPETRESAQYAQFWKKLAGGEPAFGQFRRLRKDGREVWICAAYNPIPGPDGKIAKIVKFGSDVTDHVQFVQSVGRGLSALASGDLNQRLDFALTPELEEVRDDFNSAVQSLREAMQRMAQSAEQVQARVDQLNGSAQALASRSESQAASLEQSAAALNEVTSTVERTGHGMDQARILVESAKKGAHKASDVMQETVKAMSSLEASSSQIARITGTIDEIAFQTNLLALNAGVEAARAGDAGRGFAVVASEVRGLAQRSAEAAKEIKGLVTASDHHVGLGVELVAKTRAALDEIIASVGDMSQVVSEIAASARDQSGSLKQINEAISQMSSTTQQNACMVQETNAATAALRQDSRQVVDLLGAFDCGDRIRPAKAQELRRSA